MIASPRCGLLGGGLEGASEFRALRHPVDLRALHIVLRAARASAERRDARIVEPLDERERGVRAQSVERPEHHGADDAGPTAAREAAQQIHM